MKEKNSIYKYLTTKEVKKIKQFIKGKETPFLIVDLKKVEENYDQLNTLLPFAKIYYAVKANPMDEIVSLLKNKGSNFDTASIYEIDQCLRLGIPPERLSYGNPIKKDEHIRYAYKKGIRLFSTDSFEDVEKIAQIKNMLHKQGFTIKGARQKLIELKTAKPTKPSPVNQLDLNADVHSNPKLVNEVKSVIKEMEAVVRGR